jgi:DNA-directed RNA polymerase specialized sigma subunit
VAAVRSEAVAKYHAHVTRLARKYVGYSQAEADDLVQEGYIAVWQTLARGLRPSTQVIEGRMLDWCNFLGRLQRNDAIAYELMLPIENYFFLDE